jgi:anoctamin-1
MPYDTSAYIKKKWKKIVDRLFMDQKHFPPISHRFTAIYSRDKEYLFDLSEESIKNLFNSSIRARIVQFILERVKYSKEGENGNDFSFGIERLISDEAYIAAYPLHDGDLNSEGSKRNSLYQNWASMKVRKFKLLYPIRISLEHLHF